MKTLIVDANSLGYFFNSAGRLSVGGKPVQATFGVIKKVRELRMMSDAMIFLWDERAQWRYDLLPVTDDHSGYKGERDKNPKQKAERDAYKMQTDDIKLGLKLLGITQMSASNYEADDLAGYLSTKMKGRVELVTLDKDWLQLVKDNVTWFDFQNNNRVTTRNYFEATGYFNGFQFLQGKCLHGDPSDKIPPVGGIGAKGAPEFLAEHKNVAQFIRKVESGEYAPKKKAHRELATIEKKRNFVRNYKLMQLLNVEAPKKENTVIEKSAFNKDEFKEFCERMAFASILSDFDNFVKPFEGN